MRKVVSAKANDDFTLNLEFNDGTIRRFDAKPYLDRGVFTELKNLEYFKKIHLVFGTVQWENEQDFAPDTLYLESIEITEENFIKV